MKKIMNNINFDEYLKQEQIRQINAAINAQLWKSKEELEIAKIDACYSKLNTIIDFLKDKIENKEKLKEIEKELEDKKQDFKKLLIQSIRSK